MKIKLLAVFFIINFYNVNFATEHNYKGGIQISLKEQDGSKFNTFTSFETTIDKKIISYIRRTSGQHAVMSNGALHMDPSKLNKYHSSFNILQVKGDIFKAKLELFSNSMEYITEKSKGTLRSNLIATHQIEGSLFTNNKYNFIEKGNPNLYVKLNFDKVFTEEEIKERFRKQSSN